MFRRIVICLPLTVILLTVAIAEAQQPAKIPRIGLLRPSRSDHGGSRVLIDAFRQGLDANWATWRDKTYSSRRSANNSSSATIASTCRRTGSSQGGCYRKRREYRDRCHKGEAQSLLS